MEILLKEHGEVLMYGIVGVIIVIVVCYICGTKWKSVSADYNTVKSKNSSHIKVDYEQYPKIVVDEVIYADYKNTGFDYGDYIKATNCKGQDISDKLVIYGTVDVLKKGVYKLRCVVTDNQLVSTKYVNVIVE